MAYSNAAPIPLHKKHRQPKGPPEQSYQRSDALRKATKKLLQHLLEGTRQGEGLQGLTLSPWV